MTNTTPTICLSAGERPVLWAGDVIVAGASFGGIAAALALAKKGKRVAIVEPRTYPGRELTATQRPWLAAATGQPEDELIQSCLDLTGNVRSDDEVALHLDQLKIHLEDTLAAAGVELYYASYPVGLLERDGTVSGVVIADKSGRQLLLGDCAIDATETALLARLAAPEIAASDEPTVYRRTLEFGKLPSRMPRTLDVPADLGVVGNHVTLHRGAHSEGHWYVDYGLLWPGRAATMQGAANLKRQIEALGLAVTLHLRHNVPSFAPPAIVGSSSYESCGPFAGPPAGPTSRFRGPMPGLMCLNEHGLPECGGQCDVRVAVRLGRELAEAVLAAAAVTMPATGSRPGAAPCSAQLEWTVREQDVVQRGRAFKMASVPAALIPVVAETDVLVVGGGSSGAIAAIAATDEGVTSAVVDMNPGLGGTGTYGGINTYWFGRRIGFVDQNMAWMDEMHDRLQVSRPKGTMAHWNVEARVQALREQSERAGVETLLNALVFGTAMHKEHVRGVALATHFGPVAALGRVTLDATGDADVAAWAGAETVYGSEREHVVMWGYMPQLAAPDAPRNVKTSMVDTTNIVDYNRMIRAERRRAGPGDYDHGVYLAPRESRHIRGKVVMTLTDHLVRRAWPDVIYIAFSNYDMKGEGTSDWVRMGIQPPNVTMEVSYRSLVPDGVEDILVVGKAFSADHDASASPRMQPDLENLGGAAAVAAAMALSAGVSVRQLDIRALQERLAALTVLPDYVLTRKLVRLSFTREQLEALVDTITGEQPLHAYSNQEVGEYYAGRIPEVDVMCAGPEAVPVLEGAFEKAQGRRKTRLAQMLCMLGSQVAVPYLLATLQEAFSGDELPARPYAVKHQGPPPDQGADTEEAHLLGMLAMVCDERIVPLWRRVVDLLEGTTREEMFDRSKDRLGYAAVVAYGAERLGSPLAAPILAKLHSYPLFGGLISRSGQQADWFLERLAYGELLTARAMARCGSPEGYMVLINYLDDVRASLAEHAHEELISITGEDYGKNVSAWANWLELAGDDLQPKPYRASTEPVKAWQETILIEEQPPAEVFQ